MLLFSLDSWQMTSYQQQMLIFRSRGLILKLQSSSSSWFLKPFETHYDLQFEGTYNTLFYHKGYTHQRETAGWSQPLMMIITQLWTQGKQHKNKLSSSWSSHMRRRIICPQTAELDSNGFKYKVYYTDVCYVQPWPCICESVLCVMQPPPGLRYMVASSHTTK